MLPILIADRTAGSELTKLATPFGNLIDTVLPNIGRAVIASQYGTQIAVEQLSVDGLVHSGNCVQAVQVCTLSKCKGM